VLPSTQQQQQQNNPRPGLPPTGGGKPIAPLPGAPAPPVMRRPSFNPFQGGGFVLTRLHVRYTKESLGEDLTFRAAPAIVGGREMLSEGKLEHGAQPSSINNFQARYAIRHAWTGPIDCKEPRRGVWGGKPGGNDKPITKAAAKLGLAPHVQSDLASYVKQDIPEIGFTRGAPAGAAPGVEGAKKGCLGCAVAANEGAAPAAWLAGLGALVVAVRRKKRQVRSDAGP
jgi:hypothetical protein